MRLMKDDAAITLNQHNRVLTNLDRAHRGQATLRREISHLKAQLATTEATTCTTNNDYGNLREGYEKLENDLLEACNWSIKYQLEIEGLERERDELKRELEVTNEQLSTVREEQADQVRISQELRGKMSELERDRDGKAQIVAIGVDIRLPFWSTPWKQLWRYRVVKLTERSLLVPTTLLTVLMVQSTHRCSR
jgi:chromosome segregation ATPase